MIKKDAGYWIKKLQLVQHEEGGWYTLLYRSPFLLSTDFLPENFSGNRPIVTSIYFLLESHGFSAMHRIASDEIWHFHTGDALLVYEIDTTGTLTIHQLGADAEAGQHFQCVVKAGSWFGARVAAGGDYALVGCTVAPGFDYAEFELGERDSLIALFPGHRSIITSLTRTLV